MLAKLDATEEGLKLVNMMGMWVITGIKGNLMVGRKFNLRVTGFNVGELAKDVVPITSVIFSANWLNTHSMVSYHMESFTTKVSLLNILVGGTTARVQTTSGSVTTADNMDVYENTAVQLFFKIRVPTNRAAGMLTVEHMNNDDQSL